MEARLRTICEPSIAEKTEEASRMVPGVWETLGGRGKEGGEREKRVMWEEMGAREEVSAEAR